MCRLGPAAVQVDLLPGGLEGEALEQLQAIVGSLNPLATVIACEQAKVGSFGGNGSKRGAGWVGEGSGWVPESWVAAAGHCGQPEPPGYCHCM
jgi:hypothetical protein